jgi:hypothetical protein
MSVRINVVPSKHPWDPNSLYPPIYLPLRDFLKKRGQNIPRDDVMFPYCLANGNEHFTTRKADARTGMIFFASASNKYG